MRLGNQSIQNSIVDSSLNASSSKIVIDGVRGSEAKLSSSVIYRINPIENRSVSPINMRVVLGPGESISRVSRPSNTILETVAGDSDHNGNRASSIRRIIINSTS